MVTLIISLSRFYGDVEVFSVLPSQDWEDTILRPNVLHHTFLSYGRWDRIRQHFYADIEKLFPDNIEMLGTVDK